MRDKPRAINSLLHILLIFSYPFTSLELWSVSSCLVSSPLDVDVIQRGANHTERLFPGLHWHGGQHVCMSAFGFKGPGPSVTEQVQDFSCTISTAVPTVAEMLLSDFCNIKS